MKDLCCLGEQGKKNERKRGMKRKVWKNEHIQNFVRRKIFLILWYWLLQLVKGWKYKGWSCIIGGRGFVLSVFFRFLGYVSFPDLAPQAKNIPCLIFLPKPRYNHVKDLLIFNCMCMFSSGDCRMIASLWMLSVHDKPSETHTRNTLRVSDKHIILWGLGAKEGMLCYWPWYVMMVLVLGFYLHDYGILI